MRVDVSFDARIRQAFARQIELLNDASLGLGPPEDLAARVANVRERFGHGQPAQISEDRIEAALRKLRALGPRSLKLRERYALACALTQASASLGGRVLIGEENLVSGLLQYWEAEGHAECLRTSMWLGLFRSYLQAPAGDSTARLRQLLRGTLQAAAMAAKGRSPALLTVQRHEGLLSDAPCKPYVEELLEGRRSKIDDLLTQMAPPASSWFWDNLALTVATQIDELDKRSFKERIPLLLSVTRHPRLSARRDALLGKALERYARMLDRPPHDGLLGYALEYWKSPQLKSNHLWSQVDPDTKLMVCGWLVTEDLEDFFRLCSPDRPMDVRRLKYWLRFKDQIEFSQIALSSPLEQRHDSKPQDLVLRKEGRLARLIEATAEGAALIMKIGEFVFVEFSPIGSACYPYRVKHLPFATAVDAYRESVLKSEAAVTKSRTRLLRHENRWESEFDAHLRGWGIYPDALIDQSHDASHRRGHTSQNAAQLETRSPVGALPHTFVQAIVAMGATVQDLRSQGGSLWIYPGVTTAALDRELRELGFRLQPGRGYRRD